VSDHQNYEAQKAKLSPVWTHSTQIIVDHGKGSWLYDINGKAYLDFTCGIGVTNTGHCHPKVVEAIQKQAGLLLHGQANIIFHKPMLELVPVLKELLTNFISSSYGPLIKTLGAALPLLSVDPFLHSHAETIVKDIKVQALLQCTLPYSSLKLEKIANAFDMDVAEIEVELAQLISSGRIQARIDSQSRTLVARGDDKRDVGIRGALEASEHIVAESRAMLLRVNLLENFVVYTPAKASSRSAKAAAPSMLAQAESGERDEGESENEDLMEDMRSD